MELACKKDIEKIFGIKITNEDNFIKALTHSSYSQENNLKDNYERLEFLGDAVLKLSVSEILYKMYPDYSEGGMSKIRSIVISDSVLSDLADELQIAQYIYLSNQEEKMGGRNKQSIKACVFEALLGAFYLEGEFKKVENFLQQHLTVLIDKVDKNFDRYNSKEVLQEYTQGINKKTPEYRVINEEGPSHNKTFTVEVLFENRTIAQGCGKTKREAEKNAAYAALLKLKEEK